MNVNDDCSGLRFTLSVLSGACQLQIVAQLFDGPQSPIYLYQQLPSINLCSFARQLWGLWHSGLISVSLNARQGLCCRLTNAGRSLQHLISVIGNWGVQRVEAAEAEAGQLLIKNQRN